jgi:putative hydrolase of the HAD superfamily
MNAVCFDLDGTLLSFERPYRDLLADAFERVAGECRDRWLDRYDEAFYDAFGRCEPDPVRRGFEAVDADLDTAALVEALLDREIAACRPAPDLEAALDRLAGEYRLGVLTNGVPDWQRRKLRAHGLENRFDAVVASYEAGAHKPEPAPFRLAERRLPADGYLMVGDSDADVEGARAAGWTAHRYDGGGFGDLPGALQWD